MSGKSRAELVVDLLKAYSTWVALGTAAVVAAVLIVQPTLPTVTIPRWGKVGVLAMIGATVLGYVPASKALDWLYDPPKRYVVCLGLSGGEPGIWELSPAAWEEVYVTEGELYEWPETTWPIYEAERFDPESMTAKGTWRGSVPDRELLRREKLVYHMRNKLERDAETSIDTEISISSRVRQAVKEIGRAIIDEHAQASTYNGERVADVLSEIRQDVEDDAGRDRSRDGQRPVNSEGDAPDALEALAGLADVAAATENREEVTDGQRQ